MDGVAIELSSDDSDCSVQDSSGAYTTNTARNRSPRNNGLKKDQRKSVDSLVSTSESISTSKGKKKNCRKTASSKESVITKKTTVAAERQALKRKLADEKKAANEANKIYKPGECMKHMAIEMHPLCLDSWYCADIPREANAVGVHIRPSSSLCDTALVLWSRLVPPTLINNQGTVELTPRTVRCGHGLYVQRVEEVAELVAEHALSERLKTLQSFAGCKLTLVLFGVKDYFKSKGRKTVNSGRKLITEGDLEKAVTDLLVSADCDTVMVNTPNELALTVLFYTKAIAEEPYKQAKRAVDEQADFYMRGDNKNCVAVDKDGHGLSRLWQQMLAVLPLASLDSSRALCARYPTPLALFEALESPGALEDVADVGVARTAAPGAKARRVGREFARKLHILFTATDGNTLLE